MIITRVVFEREKEQQFFGFFRAGGRHHRLFVNHKYLKKEKKKNQDFLEISKQPKSDSMNG